MKIPDYFEEELYGHEQEPKELRNLALMTEGEQHHGQARMAYRLAATHAEKLMFVRGLGWHIWDGTRWAPDEKDEATTAVLATLRDALADSLHDKELRAGVVRCESANGIAGVLDIAKAIPELRASSKELDADPYLLNCANGTLDLRTRRLRPHDPADRITRVCTGAYDPTMGQDTWTKFLEQVLPDDDERSYLQRVIGQAVFGAVREHLFPVLTGEGANGKGTAYGAITHAMGDYATIIDPSLLMAKQHGAGGPEMMQLFGARLVIGSETEEGKQLDAPLMKRLTGGDAITARHLYQPPVTWEPTHQIVYVTNHLPQVKGNDPAVWRRVRVLPFDVVVPEEHRDKELPETLKLHADAILTWAVQGWFDYQDEGGMREPERVQQATDAYQSDSDAVKRFIQERCLTNPHFNVRARELYQEWCTWALQDGAEKLSEKRFAGEMDRLGFGSEKTRTGKFWQGLALPAEADGESL